jgi:hypothetical protein
MKCKNILLSGMAFLLLVNTELSAQNFCDTESKNDMNRLWMGFGAVSQNLTLTDNVTGSSITSDKAFASAMLQLGIRDAAHNYYVEYYNGSGEGNDIEGINFNYRFLFALADYQKEYFSDFYPFISFSLGYIEYNRDEAGSIQEYSNLSAGMGYGFEIPLGDDFSLTIMQNQYDAPKREIAKGLITSTSFNYFF